MNDYISKPVSLTEFINKMEKWAITINAHRSENTRL
jgi:YesN/AraC family two-component response regulator